MIPSTIRKTHKQPKRKSKSPKPPKAPRSPSKPPLTQRGPGFDRHLDQFRWKSSASRETVKWQEETQSVWNPRVEGKSRRHHRSWTGLIHWVPHEYLHEEDMSVLLHNEEPQRGPGFMGQVWESAPTWGFGCRYHWDWHGNRQWCNVNILRWRAVYLPRPWRAWHGKTQLETERTRPSETKTWDLLWQDQSYLQYACWATWLWQWGRRCAHCKGTICGEDLKTVMSFQWSGSFCGAGLQSF